MIDLYTQELTVEQLDNLVSRWAIARNIVPETTGMYEDEYPYTTSDDIRKFQLAQYEKLLEEVDELRVGIENKDDVEIVDAIGDVMVCLAIQADAVGLSLQHCFAHAYEEIKDRKGKMVNGIFVKEAE